MLGNEYVQANVESGCLVSNDNFHRKCACDEVSDSGFLSRDQCQSLCSNDPGCKGYVMLTVNRGNQCQLATDSSCPVSCRGPYQESNIGPIDPNAKYLHGNYNWNGGCLIKRGITTALQHNYRTNNLIIIIIFSDLSLITLRILLLIEDNSSLFIITFFNLKF